MRNGIGAGEQSSADFAAGGVTVRVQNARPTVCGFAREGKLRAGAVEFGAPFDELRDVFRAFFDEKRDGFGSAQTVSGIDSVLLMQADFVFIAEGDGDAALCPRRGGVA